jgi:hypothetical protein
MKHNTIAVVLTVFLSSATALGWGGNTHKFIGKEFGKHIPPSMGFVVRNVDAVSAHSSDPDGRKDAAHPNESQKHFMDQDIYPEFFTGKLPHTLDSMNTKYGASAVLANGILPWAIAETFDSLVSAFRSSDSLKLILYLSDLSHYVADATQPLHVTMNYNPGGLHSRYETTMMNPHLVDIVIVPVTVPLVTRSVLDDAFDLMAVTWPYVDSVIHADSVAKVAAGGSTSGSVYLASLWSQTQVLTTKQVQLATEKLASLMYTAYMRAGNPMKVENQTLAASGFALEQNYPNPFNPATTIRYTLDQQAHVALTVYDAVGRVVRTLVNDNLSAGTYQQVFDASNLSSGVYFYRLQVGSRVETKHMMLVR